MIPSPADLTYFLEVANSLNLSRAAESLGISQPSLTLAIQRLEKSVGTPVLIRHKRGVTLTKSGKQLLAHTRQLIEHWETIKAETLASNEEVQGSYVIGCHSSVALFSLPRFLTELMQAHPKLHIRLQHELSRKITEKVINLTIDIGIVVNPVRHPDLVIRQLDQDLVQFFTSPSKSHPTRNLASGSAIILCDPEMNQAQSLLKSLKKNNLSYERLIASNHLELIAQLTKAGCGVGILPTKVAKGHGLKPIKKAPTYHDDICLLYRGENRNVKAIQAISAVIKKAFA